MGDVAQLWCVRDLQMGARPSGPGGLTVVEQACFDPRERDRREERRRWLRTRLGVGQDHRAHEAALDTAPLPIGCGPTMEATMPTDRIHRASSTDGTEIAARVHGDGPPIVLLPGGPGDGEISWQTLLPHLAEHFTCYPVSTRNRGLSGKSGDCSFELLEADLRSFVDSIGEPVGLVAWSSSAPMVLETAARSDAVSAVAIHEPTFRDQRSPDVEARHQDALERLVPALAEERLVDAARIFYEGLAMASDEELAGLEELGTFEASAPNIPVMVEEALVGAVGQMSDNALLADVTAPVLLLIGTESQPYYSGVVRYVADQVPDVRVRELPGVGHFAPAIAPEVVASELTDFFDEVGLAHAR
jgi:pimeloyl-ACP methyl ester carboxylesterase